MSGPSPRENLEALLAFVGDAGDADLRRIEALTSMEVEAELKGLALAPLGAPPPPVPPARAPQVVTPAMRVAPAVVPAPAAAPPASVLVSEVEPDLARAVLATAPAARESSPPLVAPPESVELPPRGPSRLAWARASVFGYATVAAIGVTILASGLELLGARGKRAVTVEAPARPAAPRVEAARDRTIAKTACGKSDWATCAAMLDAAAALDAQGEGAAEVKELRERVKKKGAK